MKKLAIFWILIFSLQIFAQSNTGSIKAIITDKEGAVIPNAYVKAVPIVDNKFIDDKSLFAITNADGEFNFLNVPIGFYELQIKVSWSEIVVKKRVNVINDKFIKSNSGLTTYVIEPCSDVIETKDLLTNTDKTEIVREMLKGASIYDKSKPILSFKNIKSQWLGNEEKKRFDLMKQSKIQYRADTKGDFEYYSFPVFKVKGTCVEISLSYFFAQGKTSKVVYLSGEGSTYEFRKIDGKWLKKLVMKWVS